MTPEEILTYVGTAAGTALGAFAIYVGWKKPPNAADGGAPPPNAPFNPRDVGHPYALLDAQTRAANALERLSDTMEGYVSELRIRESNRAREAEIDKRAHERAEDLVRDQQLDARIPRKS